jgi:hypothetical protein
MGVTAKSSEGRHLKRMASQRRCWPIGIASSNCWLARTVGATTSARDTKGGRSPFVAAEPGVREQSLSKSDLWHLVG